MTLSSDNISNKLLNIINSTPIFDLHTHLFPPKHEGYFLLGFKNLLNYIEDRRIDSFIFRTSPGYKGYYHAMYDKYFNAKIIDKALILGENSEENWDNYLFHICNFINPNRNLTALPKLQEVWDLINIKDISRGGDNS